MVVWVNLQLIGLAVLGLKWLVVIGYGLLVEQLCYVNALHLVLVLGVAGFPLPTHGLVHPLVLVLGLRVMLSRV